MQQTSPKVLRELQPLASGTGISAHAIAAGQGHAKSRQKPDLLVITYNDGPSGKTIRDEALQNAGLDCKTILCDELPGQNNEERGAALLAMLAQADSTVPTIVHLHAEVKNGELILYDAAGSIALSASTLLHQLAQEGSENAEQAAAPVLLSCCHARELVKELLATGQQPRRPLIINGGKHELNMLDASHLQLAMIAELGAGKRGRFQLSAGQLFERLQPVTGEPLTLLAPEGNDEHRPLKAAGDPADIGALQQTLYLRAKLVHGSADKLAAAFLALGFDAYQSHFDPESNPALRFMAETPSKDFPHKLVLMLALGEDPNQQDEEGDSLLHLACAADDDGAGGDLAMARIMLANGADPNLPNHHGQTAFDLARAAGDAEMLALLSERNPAVAFADCLPGRLLAHAAGQGWSAVVRLMLERTQVDPQSCDKKGVPALQLALLNGHDAVADLLRQAIEADLQQDSSTE